HNRGAAADADLEAVDAVALTGEEGDVVDAADRAVGVGAGEGSLDLARHQLRRRVADEVADVGVGVAGRVEDLVGGDAGPGVAGDVADRVAAALARGEAGVRYLPQKQLGVAQRHVVDLDVLPGGDVAFVNGAYLSTTLAKAAIWPGVTPPTGSLIRIIWTSGWRWP